MNPVFVGRDTEQERLKELLKETTDYSLRVAFIAGEQGDGKTALIEYFLNTDTIQELYPKLNYAIGSCQEIAKEKGYKPFQEIFAQLTGVRSQEIQSRLGSKQEFDLKQKIQIATRILAKVAPDIIGVLAPPVSLLMKVAIETSDQIIGRRIEVSNDSSINEEQLKSQCVRFFSDLSKNGPLILVFDDTQWIDPSSLNLIRYLHENMNDLPILLILTYRPNEISLDSDLSSWMNEVIQQYGDITLDLRANRDDSRGYDFISSFLKQNGCDAAISKSFIQEFYKRSQAKPLIAVELLNYLISSEILIKNSLGLFIENDKATQWMQIPPRITKIEALIENRLRQIEEELLDILYIASIEGHEFTAQVIVKVTGETEKTILKALDRLDRQHGLVRDVAEENVGTITISRYRFSNILYQEYIYNRKSAGLQRIGHSEVAKALEELYIEDVSQIAVFLAKHYDLAKNYRKAAEYLIMVGNQQIENRRNDEGIQTLERALNLADTSGYTDGIIDSHRLIGTQLVGKLEYGLAEKHLDEAIKLAKEHNNHKALSYSLRGMGRIRRSQKRSSEAMYLYMEGLNIAKLTDDLRLAGPCINNIGVILSDDEGRYDEAIYFYQQRLEIAQKLGDKNGEAIALINIGNTLRKKGDYKDARRYLNEAMEIASDRADWFLECGINIPLAYVEIQENYTNKAAQLLFDTIITSTEKKNKQRRVECFICAADVFASIKNIQVATKILGNLEKSTVNRSERERISHLIFHASPREDLETFMQQGRNMLLDDLQIEITELLIQIANSN